MIPEAHSEWYGILAYSITALVGYKDANLPQPSCSYTLDSHHGISHLLSSRYPVQRIIPLSRVKSHNVAHWKVMDASPHLIEDDVYLDNAQQHE